MCPPSVVSNENDFEGYRIYRSTEPDFLDPQVISTGTGSGTLSGNGRPIAQFDLVDGKTGYSRRTVDGVAYWLEHRRGGRIVQVLDHDHRRPTQLAHQLQLLVHRSIDVGPGGLSGAAKRRGDR